MKLTYTKIICVWAASAATAFLGQLVLESTLQKKVSEPQRTIASAIGARSPFHPKLPLEICDSGHSYECEIRSYGPSVEPTTEPGRVCLKISEGNAMCAPVLKIGFNSGPEGGKVSSEASCRNNSAIFKGISMQAVAGDVTTALQLAHEKCREMIGDEG